MGVAAPMESSPDDAGRFEVRGVIGRGAHSVVLRAYDRETETEVALKRLEGWSPEAIYRLKREFRILRSLRHPGLVEMYELFSGGGTAYFSMELIDGSPFVPELADALPGADSPQREPLPPNACTVLLERARELASALNLVHAAGIVHRDVKPSNVLERRSGGVVLLDFGLAAYRQPEGIDRMIERGPAGTWVYMAPEAILGRPPTPACDWYSLAVLLFEAIAGRPLFHGSAADVWLAKQTPPAEIGSWLSDRVPDRVGALLISSLDPDPARRPDGAVWTEVLEETCATEAATASSGCVVLAQEERRKTFVGRERELAQLESLYRQVVRGRTVAVHIEGAGGMGKTELVREFLRRLLAADEGPLVLRARCHPQELLPFNAVDGIVDELALWLVSDVQARGLSLSSAEGNALVRMFPILGTFVTADPAEASLGAQPRETRRIAFEALRGLLVQLSETRPLVLWIDDMQWADADSVSLLEAVLRPPEAPRALLILCHRPEPEGAASALLLGSPWRPWAEVVHVLSLGPLDESAATRLLEDLGSGGGSPLLEAQAVLDEAGGSPLLLVQLASHLRRGKEGKRASGLLLRDVVGAWMERLPSPARRILELAAVAARPLERSLLLRMAGLGERGRPLVALLESALLLQTSRAGERVLIEPYHQRIGEALYDRMPAADAQRVHALLASSLAGEGNVEEERVYFHWRAAGRRQEASIWATRAGDRAFLQLAFDQAADLYGEALALWSDLPARTAKQIGRKRAEALVNAGRGAEAAVVFLTLAQEEEDRNALHELQRRAAEELLMSGRVAEGTTVLQNVLERVGAHYPRTPGQALRRSALAILPLWVAERRARARSGVTQTRRSGAEAHCDACHAAAKGLSLVDPSRGLYFSIAALWWALRSGDVRRVARSLSFVGSNLLPLGGMFSRWATNMIDRAAAIARTTGDPYLQAVTGIGLAQVRMIECRWEDMASLCEQALGVLRAECRGTTWEISIATMAKFRALEECGAFPELHRQAASWIHEANRTGNRYAEVTALLYEGMCALVRGEPNEARALAVESRRLWVHPGFHVQHFYAARLAALCDMYEGRPLAAVSQCAPIWPALERGGFARHAIFRLDALMLQGRLALACLEHQPEDQKRYRRELEHVVRRLEKEHRTDASAWALVFRAALAIATDERSHGAELLARAEQKFESARMALGAAVAAYRASDLCPTPVGEAARQRAQEFFSRAGVASAEAWVGMLAPGFPRLPRVTGPKGQLDSTFVGQGSPGN